MHRGSSKGVRLEGRPPEPLPLSAPPVRAHVVLDLARGGRNERRELDVALGTTVAEALRSIGRHPEGCAVLERGHPVPLDRPLLGDLTLTVVSTFSGG